MARATSNQRHEKLMDKFILGLNEQEMNKLTIVTERVVQQLDKISRLNNGEENLIHVALVIAYREFNKPL